MEGSTAVAPPPQRVCPKCARISWATGPNCPYCTARFRSGRGVTPWMLALTGAIVLIGVAIMLLIGARIYEDRLDDRVGDVTRSFDSSLNKFREDVRKELDARLPAGGVAATVTPGPVPTVTAQPTETPDPFATETATPSPEATTTPEASPTETPHEEIRP